MAVTSDKETPRLHDSKISFDDIVGHKHIIERLKNIIHIIKNPKALEHFNTPSPKGILIYGPSSVGKSMLARAFAKASGLRYLEISGSKLFEVDHIKEVYEMAGKHAPTLVILEDIDIRGIMQGAITNVSFSDIAKIISQSKPGVFTIATAERLEEIDQSLIAPGVLDFLLEVSKLDKDARHFFVEKILRMPHAKTIDVERIVRYITGMSAMELERLGRMAALSCVEQGKKELTEEILIEQINIIKYGHKIETQMIKNLELELKMTAYHEASHAVISLLLLPQIKIEQVTIAPRSKMLGFVSYNIEDQISNVTKEELFYDICVLLAGQIAKAKVQGPNAIDSGAIDDLSQASLNAYTAIATLGMDKVLGMINVEGIMNVDNFFLSEQIEKRFLHWMHTAEQVTKRLVESHWDKIETLADQLIADEIVESDKLIEIIGDVSVNITIPESI